MHSVDPSRLDLCNEFRESPIGPHSPDLQKLIKLLRWERIESRYLLVQPKRGKPWFLAHTTGPKAHPLEIFWNQEFTDLPSAYWALFKARWEANTGQRLVLGGVDDPVIPQPGEGDLTLSASDRPILSYSNVFSVAPGGQIEFKISSTGDAPFHAEIVQIRCGDGTPEGPAFHETPIDSAVTGDYPARIQDIDVGSYVEIGHPDTFDLQSFTLQAYVWPTTPRKGEQALHVGLIDGCDRADEHGHHRKRKQDHVNTEIPEDERCTEEGEDGPQKYVVGHLGRRGRQKSRNL